jgi:hypothetical protein
VLSDDVTSITGTAPRPLRTFIADNIQAFTRAATNYACSGLGAGVRAWP